MAAANKAASGKAPAKATPQAKTTQAKASSSYNKAKAPAKATPTEKTTKAKAPVYKFPKSMGACADVYYELKAKRAAAQKVVDALEAEEKALKNHIIDNLPKSQATGVAGKVARVAVVLKPVPTVEDWDAFTGYVKKNNAFDLFQKRISTAAVEERIDAGKKIPGVKMFNAVTVSLHKI